jgi:hypothetical protein
LKKAKENKRISGKENVEMGFKPISTLFILAAGTVKTFLYVFPFLIFYSEPF